MKSNTCSIKINLFISINCNYDYTASYMENIARNFTKKYPSYLIHKKSEDKIKGLLDRQGKSQSGKLCECRGKERDSDRGAGNSRPDSGIRGNGAPVPLWKPSGGRPLAGKHRCGACHERGHRRIRHPPRQCSQARRRIGEAQDNEAECYPCNSGAGSADGNQAIPAIPATSSGPVQPA